MMRSRSATRSRAQAAIELADRLVALAARRSMCHSPHDLRAPGALGNTWAISPGRAPRGRCRSPRAGQRGSRTRNSCTT
jgi:hypothetical protein